ncbi:MAG: IS66 family insertion sequence element accessory protein TnpB, partial [Clostridium sp.]
GILEQSYYKWQQKFRKETFELMQATDVNAQVAIAKDNISFAEIPVKSNQSKSFYDNSISPAAVIKTSSMTITISNEISESLLTQIIREVSANA